MTHGIKDITKEISNGIKDVTNRTEQEIKKVAEDFKHVIDNTPLGPIVSDVAQEVHHVLAGTENEFDKIGNCVKSATTDFIEQLKEKFSNFKNCTVPVNDETNQVINETVRLAVRSVKVFNNFIHDCLTTNIRNDIQCFKNLTENAINKTSSLIKKVGSYNKEFLRTFFYTNINFFKCINDAFKFFWMNIAQILKTFISCVV